MCWVRLALVFSWIIPLSSCFESPLKEAQYFVFGTQVQVSLADVNEELADRAFADLQQRFQAMHRDWHAWEPGKLTAINQAFSNGATAPADAEMIKLVQFSQQMEKKSGGRFNAGIGQLIRLWGFHTSEFPIRGPAPAASDIAALVALHPSTMEIEISDGVLHTRNRSVQLDFGGIAKGYAVDLACDRLKQLGVMNAIVNAGGDLRAFGSRGSKPWRVAIRNPLGGILGGLEIHHDEAVFTSGNYERYRETDTLERFPHILDPRNGWPARQIMSATVVTDQGWLADAAATALVVAGLDEWPEVAAAMEIDLVLIVDEQGKVYVTPDLLERLELVTELEPVVISLPKG